MSKIVEASCLRINLIEWQRLFLMHESLVCLALDCDLLELTQNLSWGIARVFVSLSHGPDSFNFSVLQMWRPLLDGKLIIFVLVGKLIRHRLCKVTH